MEWEATPRETADDVLGFYRTQVSWIFDTMWYHAHQYAGDQPPESVMIAERLGTMPPGKHLDFGAGPGTTSIIFSRLGIGWPPKTRHLRQNVRRHGRYLTEITPDLHLPYGRLPL